MSAADWTCQQGGTYVPPVPAPSTTSNFPAGVIGITPVSHLTTTDTVQAALAELVGRVYALENPAP